MDLNPRQFTAAWDLYEFATNALASSTQLLLLSMAWLTQLPSSALQGPAAREPDLETLKYWFARLKPLVRQTERDVTVVVANRCGEEGPEARYAGTSWVGKVGRGNVGVWRILGKGEEGVLVVDTEEEEIRWRWRWGEQED
jgi:protein N-terminal amidase